MAVWTIGYTFLDSEGKKAVTHFYLPGTLTAVHVQEFIDAQAPLIDAVTDCKLTGATATLVATLPGGLKADPAPNTDVEEGARFGWQTDTLFLAGNRIAGFKESLMTGEIVNQGQAAVISFRNSVTAGLTTASGLAAPVDSHGDDIVNLVSARDQHKSER